MAYGKQGLRATMRKLRRGNRKHGRGWTKPIVPKAKKRAKRKLEAEGRKVARKG